MIKRLGTRSSKAFTLIELSVVLVILGVLISVAVQAIPKITERYRLNKTRTTIGEVREALMSFASTNSRLPCADTSATPNGLEGSGAVAGCAAAPGDSVGLLPYRALGFPDPVLDESNLPIRYAVYRNTNGGGASDADLASLPNRFIPVLPGNPPTTGFPFDSISTTRVQPATLNDLDFCLALRNGRAAANSTAFASTQEGIYTPNAAFVLLSGGVEDANGNQLDSSFDGLNEDGDMIFHSPAEGRSAQYDDIVHATTFGALESRLSCAAITVAVNSAAIVAITVAHMTVQSSDTHRGAIEQVVMDALGIASAAMALVLATFDLVDATMALAVSIAGSIIPFPHAIAAAVVAAIAEVGAIAAEVTAGIAVAASIGNTVYAGIVLGYAATDLTETTAFALATLNDALAIELRGGQQ